MNHQTHNLEDLIFDFLNKVDTGTKLLEKKFGTPCILRLWRSNQIERCGKITASTSYELHGVGCTINFPSESVDFDYGSNERTDGFDVWRLYMYAMDRPSLYHRFTDKETIERDFEKLIAEKLITKMSDSDNLYVLRPAQTNDQLGQN